MKIYRYPVAPRFQPDHQDYVWPPQNQRTGCDYGVEQSFDWWVQNQKFLVDEIDKADWVYLPIYWNRWYINVHDKDGHWGGGVDQLNQQVKDVLGYGIPTFTISEADEFVLHDTIEWGDLVMFIGSRRGEKGIDIPLLSSLHDTTSTKDDRKWLASFIGSLGTDSVRQEMYEELQNRKDCHVKHGNYGSSYFVNLIQDSYIALCPRGTAAQSFRFYEAMQIGTVPLYISDMDCRPFKNWIDWDICSLYIPSAEGLSGYLDSLSVHKEKLLKMGELAYRTYYDHLQYEKWCKWVIKELELI